MNTFWISRDKEKSWQYDFWFLKPTLNHGRWESSSFPFERKNEYAYFLHQDTFHRIFVDLQIEPGECKKINIEWREVGEEPDSVERQQPKEEFHELQVEYQEKLRHLDIGHKKDGE